ncbi:MAG: hypothetical protein V3R61_03800 [candidate division NC10 bacterium]
MTRAERWPIRPLGREEGFTVFELLIVVSVIVVMAGVGMPSFLELIQTYRLNAATQQTVAEIRKVQSLAASRGSVFGFHWGGDPIPIGRLNSEYRIERDATGACGYPLSTDTTANPDVITEWTDLTQDYTGVLISSIQDTNGTPLGGVMFNARGVSVNTCTGTVVAFPVTVTVADATGATRTIQVRSAGSLRVCPCP